MADNSEGGHRTFLNKNRSKVLQAMDQGNGRIREPKMKPKREKLVSPISWRKKKIFRKGERTLEEKPREHWE